MEDYNRLMTDAPSNLRPPNIVEDNLFVPIEIVITSLNHGYQVRVGCQTFAFENEQTMLNNIKAYLKNPQIVAENWFKTKKLPINK